MFGFVYRITLKIIGIAALLFLLYAAIQYGRSQWTDEEFRAYFYLVLKYAITIAVSIYVFYKLFLERIILYFNRKKSADVLVNKMNPINQKSGAVRSGKDASTTGAAIIIKEYILEKEKKELKKLQLILYIYDFKKLNDYLDKHHKDYFVAGEERLNKVFSRMLRRNECFIQDQWIKNGIKPREHYYNWRLHTGKKVPDVAYEDGLTPGGEPFLSKLRKYVVMYIYHLYVPQFIMSNQPIREDYDITDGKITETYSRKFSQNYIRLKEDHPMPLPLRGYMSETETAIFYSNTDPEVEADIKRASGIREFMTTAGHILGEHLFFTGITQSPTRTNKSLRELYPGYQHVFRMKFRATRDFKRKVLNLRIFLKRVRINRIKIVHWILLRFKSKSKRFKKTNKFDPGYINSRINKIRHQILKLDSKRTRLFNKGYIEFYIGVYENIGDVGKRVKFPRFGTILESKSEKITYNAFGFKQTNLITDTFGRYDTHFMKFIREEKQKKHNVHFMHIPEWDSMMLTLDDATYMNYGPMIQTLNAAFNQIKEDEQAKKILAKREQQRSKNMMPPDYYELETNELLLLAQDYGIDTEGINQDDENWIADLVNKLVIEWQSHLKQRTLKGAKK